MWRYSQFHLIYHWVRTHSTLKMYALIIWLEFLDYLLRKFNCDSVYSLSRDIHEFGYPKLQSFALVIFTTLIHSFNLMLAMITINISLQSDLQGLVLYSIMHYSKDLRKTLSKRVTKVPLLQHIINNDMIDRYQFFTYILLINMTNSPSEKLIFHSIILVILNTLSDYFKHFFCFKNNEFELSQFEVIISESTQTYFYINGISVPKSLNKKFQDNI
jgi:hypothetical protein